MLLTLPDSSIAKGAIIDLGTFAEIRRPSGHLVGFSAHWTVNAAFRGRASRREASEAEFESLELVALLRRGENGNGTGLRPWADGRWQFGWPKYDQRLQIHHAGDMKVQNTLSAEALYRERFEELFAEHIDAGKVKFRFRAIRWKTGGDIGEDPPKLDGKAAQFFLDSDAAQSTPRAGFWMQADNDEEGRAAGWIRGGGKGDRAVRGLWYRESDKARMLPDWMLGAGESGKRFLGSFKVSSEDVLKLPGDFMGLFPPVA